MANRPMKPAEKGYRISSGWLKTAQEIIANATDDESKLRLINGLCEQIYELDNQRVVARLALGRIIGYIPDDEWAYLMADIEEPGVREVLKEELQYKREIENL